MTTRRSKPTPDPGQEVTEALLALVLQVPDSQQSKQAQPAVQAQQLARAAARRASLLAGSLALPPGVLGWLTVLPELLGVWRLQAQMVSDIASVYGQHATLSREQLLYCLFKHVAAQLFRDVAVRTGERALARRASGVALQVLTKQLGPKIAQALFGKSAARFVPLIGAIGVGAYAYYDTLQVAKNACELFAAQQPDGADNAPA